MHGMLARRALLITLPSILLSIAAIARAQAFSSCSDIKGYFARPIEDQNPLQRKEELKQIVSVLKSEETNPNTECSDAAFEGGFFEYAQMLDEIGDTLSEATAVQNWKTAAVQGYQRYLDWFAGLETDRQNRLIAILTNSSPTAPTFQRTQRNWMRQRVGGVLCRI